MLSIKSSISSLRSYVIFLRTIKPNYVPGKVRLTTLRAQLRTEYVKLSLKISY